MDIDFKTPDIEEARRYGKKKAFMEIKEV